MRRHCLTVAWGVLLIAATGQAAVILPEIFAEHMVLQQGAPIAIWGSVNGPGDQVSIRFAWRSYSVMADRNGKFKILLPPMKAGGIRVGTPAVTTRGMREREMEKISAWIGEVLDHLGDASTEQRVRAEVAALASKFPLYSRRLEAANVAATR